MSQLVLNFQRKKYPYPEDSEGKSLHWGKISLGVVLENDPTLKTLLIIEWDLKPLVCWLYDNVDFLLNENYPVELAHLGASIASKMKAFYDSDADVDDSLFESVFHYRQRHGIRFAVRGTDTKDIYVGKNGSEYEISCCDDNEVWAYSVDLELFLQNMMKEFGFLLSEF